MNIQETLKTKAQQAKGLLRKMPRWGWIVGALVVVIILLIAIKKPSDDGNAIALVERRNVVDSVVLSGRTQSGSAVDLGFADQGRVERVNVKEGDAVYRGQVLASLDTSDLTADLRDAQAQLSIARAGLSNNTTNLDKITREQDALVENARRALLSEGLEAIPENTETGAVSPTIFGTYKGEEGTYVIDFYLSSSSSGISFRYSGIESGTATVVYGSAIPLGTKGLYVRFQEGITYGNSTWFVEIPNKRSSFYTSNYSAYQAALATRDRVIASAQSDLSGNDTEASIAQARVQQALAAVESIQSRIGKRRIVAPFAGIVAGVGIKPGETTSSSLSNEAAPGITLISEQDYEVALKAPEIDIAKLSVGQKADIVLDAYGADAVFPGTIVSINPAETIVDGVPVYETKVVFDAKDSRIRSGMTATATIVAKRADNVLAVPASFIHDEKDESFVYVMADDATEKRIITPGLRGSDSFVEISSGLDEGEKVRAEELK